MQLLKSGGIGFCSSLDYFGIEEHKAFYSSQLLNGGIEILSAVFLREVQSSVYPTFVNMSVDTGIRQISNRLKEGSLHRTVGRFEAVRRTYSFYQNQLQKTTPERYKDRLSPQPSTYFNHLSPASFVEEMRREGVSFGLQLCPSAVQQIYQFACDSLCTEPGYEEHFRIQEVKNGRLKDRSTLRGLVQTPETCPVIKQLAQDETLLQIVREYLNYWPTKLTCHLTWSFASQMPSDLQKEHYPPLNYHYDVAGYNFMTTYFYITNVDIAAGAHVMIRRSHKAKPIHMLFLSTGRQTDRQILSHYGKENEMVIEGKAGFGFVQDPSCYHKLLSTQTHSRLLLQIRYA